MNLVFTPLEVAAVAAAVGDQRAHRPRRRVELARGRAADARLPDPRRLVLRVRLSRAPASTDARRRTTAREGDAPPPAAGMIAIGRQAAPSASTPPRPRRSARPAAVDRRPGSGRPRPALAERAGLGRQRVRRPARPRSPSSCGPDSISTCAATISVFQCRAPCRRPRSASGAGPRWRPAGPCRGSGRRSRPGGPRSRRGGTRPSPCRAPRNSLLATVNGRDDLAAGQAAHLRVAREAPREQDLVHGPISFPVGRSHRSRPCVSGGHHGGGGSAADPGGRARRAADGDRRGRRSTRRART